jgi:hypothetical protein
MASGSNPTQTVLQIFFSPQQDASEAQEGYMGVRDSN